MRRDRRHVELNIGKLCNNACCFCANGAVPRGERAWVPRARLVAEIERAAAAGVTSLGFLGGEITLYPHAVAVVGAAREHGFTRIALCTNGRRLADARRLERLLAAGVTRVTLSIHSHVAAVEDRLNGRRGAFAQKLAAIDGLVRAAAAGRLPDGFALNCCVHGRNYETLTEMVAFFHARGVRDVRCNLVRPEHLAVGDATLVPRLAACVPALVRLMWHNERRWRLALTFADVPLCVWPDAVLRNARLARRYLGELRDLDTSVTVFRDPSHDVPPDRFTWRERRGRRLKGHAAVCERCEAGAACEGPWLRYLELHGDGELRPLTRLPGAAARARAGLAAGGRGP